MSDAGDVVLRVERDGWGLCDWLPTGPSMAFGVDRDVPVLRLMDHYWVVKKVGMDLYYAGGSYWCWSRNRKDAARYASRQLALNDTSDFSDSVRVVRVTRKVRKRIPLARNFGQALFDYCEALFLFTS